MVEYKNIFGPINATIIGIKNSIFVQAIGFVIYMMTLMILFLAFLVLPPEWISTYLNQGKDDGAIAITWLLFWVCVGFVWAYSSKPVTEDAGEKIKKEKKTIFESVVGTITEFKNSTFVGAIVIVVYFIVLLGSFFAILVLPPEWISTYLNQGKDEGAITFAWIFLCFLAIFAFAASEVVADANKKKEEDKKKEDEVIT